MSDDKHKTRAKLLNELESIKTLLDDELQELEPPILTSAIDDIDDAPLLTEIHAGDDVDAAIPVLDEAVEVPAPADIEPEEVPPLLHPEEQQQSLFEPSRPAPSSSKPEQAPAQPPAATLSSGRGENPFLPRHIRERIEANRKQQSAMMEAPGPSTAQAPAKQSGSNQAAAPAATADSDRDKSAPGDQQLIDEMVQRFLPAIEAALRERLEALLRQQRDDQEDNNS